jgi:nucleoprotein TPR
MLQANYAMLKSENHELQRRSQSLAESAAKQDLRTQQVAEDLVEARGLLDSMRNEIANLKAEKEFWKSVEKRLTEEIESHSNERNRLNILNANLQNLINEREHSDSEIRRRLQAQAESMESELQNTRRKLDTELEDGKKSALRRSTITSRAKRGLMIWSPVSGLSAKNTS